MILDGGSAKVHCSVSTFPHSNAVQCSGLKKNVAGSVDGCRDTCCGDLSCLVWQFSNVQGCWIGQSGNCSHKNAAWVGGGRDSSSHAMPPQAARDYDDRDWEVVDVPHDG